MLIQFFSLLFSVQTLEEFNKVRKYIRFLGEQMDDKSMVCYEKGSKIEWAFCNVRTKKIHTELIDKKVLFDVCLTYINWYESLDTSQAGESFN